MICFVRIHDLNVKMGALFPPFMGPQQQRVQDAIGLAVDNMLSLMSGATCYCVLLQRLKCIVYSAIMITAVDR
jgi:hypothetical protein